MNVLHEVTGYDKRTERLSVEHPVPEGQSVSVRNLAQLTPEDDGVGGYPLDSAAAVSIGLQIDRPLDADLYDWFLEPA